MFSFTSLNLSSKYPLFEKMIDAVTKTRLITGLIMLSQYLFLENFEDICFKKYSDVFTVVMSSSLKYDKLSICN